MTARRLVRCIAVVPLCGACAVSGPDCRDETRALGASARLAATTPAPADTGRAQIELNEARDARTKATATREILWFAGSSLHRADVTAVHVHEEGTDRLLFTLPLEPTQAPAFVITQVFTRRPYTGTVEWSQLYELIGNDRAYVDVHTVSRPQGHLRGPLRRENANWQIFVHAYCS